MKKYEYDLSKLCGRIVEKFGTRTAFANKLGISLQQLSPKLTGETGITRRDVVEWSEALEIPADEIGVYFFTLKVPKW